MPAATSIQFGDNLTATDLGGGTVKVDASPALQAGSAVGDVLKWTGSNWQASPESNDWVRLADLKLASPAATMDITGISQSYAHLKLVLSLRSTNASLFSTAMVRVNGGTTGYIWARAYANNTALGAAASAVGTSFYGGLVNANNSVGFTVCEFLFTDYTITTPKHCLGHSYSVGDGAVANQWREWFGGYTNSGAGINQLTAQLDSGSCATGSRMTVYGAR